MTKKSRVISEEGRRRLREGGRRGGLATPPEARWYSRLRETNPEELSKISQMGGRIGGKAPKKNKGVKKNEQNHKS